MLKASFLAVISPILAYATPLTSRQACADVTAVFARGTTEIRPIGTVVGPPFADYDADLEGFFEGGDPEGARRMANDVTSFANSCPNTAIVMSGYVKGPKLHTLPRRERVNAVVVFGDPDNGDGFPGVLDDRSITFCAIGVMEISLSFHLT